MSGRVKKFAFAGAALVAGVLPAACGGSSGSGVPGVSKPSIKEATIAGEVGRIFNQCRGISATTPAVTFGDSGDFYSDGTPIPDETVAVGPNITVHGIDYRLSAASNVHLLVSNEDAHSAKPPFFDIGSGFGTPPQYLEVPTRTAFTSAPKQNCVVEQGTSLLAILAGQDTSKMNPTEKAAFDEGVSSLKSAVAQASGGVAAAVEKLSANLNSGWYIAGPTFYQADRVAAQILKQDPEVAAARNKVDAARKDLGGLQAINKEFSNMVSRYGSPFTYQGWTLSERLDQAEQYLLRMTTATKAAQNAQSGHLIGASYDDSAEQKLLAQIQDIKTQLNAGKTATDLSFEIEAAKQGFDAVTVTSKDQLTKIDELRKAWEAPFINLIVDKGQAVYQEVMRRSVSGPFEVFDQVVPDQFKMNDFEF